MTEFWEFVKSVLLYPERVWHSLLTIIAKYGVLIKVSGNFLLWIVRDVYEQNSIVNIRVDDWAGELAIIASKGKGLSICYLQE